LKLPAIGQPAAGCCAIVVPPLVVLLQYVPAAPTGGEN